jgi:hypothetical protein
MDIKRGVRQGCVLSPTLFNIYTEMIFREIDNCKGVTIGGINITNLRYADDTVLLAESEEELQSIVNKVNAAGKKYNMKMNSKKTKTMVMSKKEIKPTIHIYIDETCTEQVQQFIYLGQRFTNDARCDAEIARRIEIARSAFRKMNSILTTRRNSIETRKRLLKCYVWSTLLYGAETWTISQKMNKRLEAFEMWSYRRMLRISWTKKVSNKEVLQLIHAKRSLIRLIRTKKLKYFGHMIRQDKIQRALLEGKINAKRGRGRPRVNWTTNIKDWSGKSYAAAVRTAQQRDDWRTIASNPRMEDGT